MVRCQYITAQLCQVVLHIMNFVLLCLPLLLFPSTLVRSCGMLSYYTWALFVTQMRGLVDGIAEQITASAILSQIVVVFIHAAIRRRYHRLDRDEDVRRYQSSGERPYDVALYRPTLYDHRIRLTGSSASSACKCIAHCVTIAKLALYVAPNKCVLR